MGDMNAKTLNPKLGHECLGFFCVCFLSLFFWILSASSSLRVSVNTQNVSYTLVYHPHTTGKQRPSSFFFFRFCGDAHCGY